jgi:DNA-binding NarL/FixJ family response regulator
MKMDKVLNVLIADDHQILIVGISSLIRNEPQINIAGTATTGFEVIDQVMTGDFDICLLDISMPGMDGIETARIMKERRPGIQIIMLTTYTDKEIVEELLTIGISGYMLKNCTKDQLLEAIAKVSSGGFYFSPEVELLVLQDPVKPKGKDQRAIVITQREMEILELLSREYTNERIATALNISYRTVETHRKNLMHKTRSHNLAGLLKYAYANKLLKAEDV